MKLSKRLETVASFVPKGSNIADIGTDHGYVPIYLVREGQAEHAVAMDVRKGPLERARAHVEAAGLGSRIDVRLSDGLAGLKPGEADCVVIAVLAGLVLSTKLWMVPIPLAAFIFVVAVTRYVSAGSLLVTIIFLAEVICFGQMGGFAMAQPYVYELYLVTFLLMALAWWRHRANIKRLLNGTENKIGFSKK